jgi:hypothetical protein
MSCEIFDKGDCLGCCGLEYDIDKLKLQCEEYQKKKEEMKNESI